MDSINQNKKICPFCKVPLERFMDFAGEVTHFVCQVPNCSGYTVIGDSRYYFITGNRENQIDYCQSSYSLAFQMDKELNQTVIWDGVPAEVKRLQKYAVLDRFFDLYNPEERDELLKIGKRIITNLGLS